MNFQFNPFTGKLDIVSVIPRSEDVLGSSCTGSDSDSNRTLTLAQSVVKSAGITIIKNGTGLHEGAGLDFTVADNVMTFLGPVWDTDNIRVVYFTE